MNYIEDFIRKAAAARGIDPDIAVQVAMSEGGVTDPFQRSNIKRKDGTYEPSYGAFQLNVEGGLGKEMLKSNYDPRKDWRAGIEFALDSAARQRSWAPFHGAARVRIPLDAGFSDATKPLGISLNSARYGGTGAAAFPIPADIPAPGPAPDASGVPLPPTRPGTTAAAPGNSKLADILAGLGTFAASLGSRSKSDPSANQLTPSSVDANIPSASAAAQMMAALMATRRKRYQGVTLDSGGPGGV